MERAVTQQPADRGGINVVGASDITITSICNRGHQEGGFVTATYLPVLRSGALNHPLPNAFGVLDELLTSSFTRFVRTELHLIMA
jgi:hypothetical protein